MILKLSLTVLLLYYLGVLWKYYRQDIAGMFGTAETDEGTDEPDQEPGQPGEPYTVMGESTYLPFGAEDGEEAAAGAVDEPTAEDDGADYNEIIGDDRIRSPFDEINDRQLRTEMEGLLDRLDKREREILKHRYGLQGVKEETLEDVGKRFKITRERVRQIQNAAIEKLRDMMDYNDRVSSPEESEV